MADVQDGDGAQPVVDLKHHPVIAAADPVAVASGQFLHAMRARILGERFDVGLDAKSDFLGQLRQLLHGPPKDGESVVHLRRRSSALACWKGMGLLWEALAASKARIASSSSKSASSLRYSATGSSTPTFRPLPDTTYC